MIYLLFAICCSALVSLVMRIGESHAENKTSMLAVNYLICMILAACYTGSGTLFPQMEGIGTAAGLGLFGGCLYLVSFVLFQWNIPQNGLGLSTTFMKLGVLVPVLSSVLIFREKPKLVQLLGLLAAVFAIFLLYMEGDEGKKKKKWVLLGLLLANGGADVVSKFYEQLGVPELKNHFLFYTFLTALILCCLLVIYRRESVGKKDFLYGALVGLPNYFSARFLLLALSHVPSVVAFPTYSVAGILLVLLAGGLLFHERLERRQTVAVTIILVALILLNL